MAFKKQNDRHLRVHFYKKQTKRGKVVTKFRLQRESFTPKKSRGLFHKLHNARDRVSGDVPSFTAALDSVKPKNKAQKAGLTAVKGVYKGARFTAKSVGKLGRAAESTFFFTADTLNPNKQAHLQFERKLSEKGKYKTSMRVVHTSKPFSKRRRGVIHNTVEFINNPIGDAPSLTKKLNSIQPETTGGKAVLGAAKGAYKFVKIGKRAAEATALSAESAALFIGDHGIRKFKRKLREASVDDSSRAILKTSSLVFTAFSKPDRYREARKEYKREKETLRARKDERKYTKASNNKFYRSEKAVLKAKKKKYERGKPGFLFARRSLIARLRFKQKKKEYKAEKKKFKKTKRQVKSANKTLKKRVKNQRRIKNLKKPQFSTGAASAYWNKLQSSVGENDDTARAITTAVNTVGSFVRENKANELERAEKKDRRLEKKSNRLQAQIKEKQYKRSNNIDKDGSKQKQKTESKPTEKDTPKKSSQKAVAPKEAKESKREQPKPDIKKPDEKKSDKKINKQQKQPKHFGKTYKAKNGSSQSAAKKKPHFKWQRFRKKYGYDENKPVEENVKEIVKNIFRRTGAAAASAVGKIMLALAPIMIIMLCIGLVVMMVTSIFESGSFILGTYTAKDVDLSDAVYEYTRIASSFNNNILLCGDKNRWKDGLYNLHAIENKSDLKTTPSVFKYSADNFSCSAGGYDFDPFVLWSFLCAYYYDFEKSEKAQNGGEKYTPEYWELDDNGYAVIQKLFDEEYKFHFDYNDQSHWDELSSYNVYPNQEGHYHSVYRPISPNDMKWRKGPDEIKIFVKDNMLHYDFNTLEILNANKGDERTGYYLADQRYKVSAGNIDGGASEISTFYYEENGNYYWGDGNERQGYSTDGKEIYFAVSPNDSYMYTGNKKFLNEDGDSMVCLVTFIQKNIWVKDITLSYVVEQKCSFTEAAKKILNGMDSYGKERISYFDLLLGNDEEFGVRRGNHQMLQCPLENKSMTDLISENRIYNGYGFDVQTWNETHCSIDDRIHYGIDISCATYDTIVSPIDGEIKEITNNRIVIENTGITFWYERNKKHSVKIAIDNVRSSGVSVGDEIKRGDVIGNPTANHICGSLNNTKASNVYIHLSVKVKYKEENDIDPHLFIE